MDARDRIKNRNITSFNMIQVRWSFVEDHGIPTKPGLYIVGYIGSDGNERTTHTYYDKYGNWRGIPNDKVYVYSPFPKAPSKITIQ